MQRVKPTSAVPPSLSIVGGTASAKRYVRASEPSHVAQYARQLLADAEAGRVRGVIVFEDATDDSFMVATVGSCNPPESNGRVLLGMQRWMLRTLL